MEQEELGSGEKTRKVRRSLEVAFGIWPVLRRKALWRGGEWGVASQVTVTGAACQAGVPFQQLYSTYSPWQLLEFCAII